MSGVLVLLVVGLFGVCAFNQGIEMVAGKFRAMVGDERGVSAAIGVILMVAVTVVCATGVGIAILTLGDAGESAPHMKPQFEYDEGSNNLRILHGGGESLTDSNTGSVSVSSDAFSASDVGSASKLWASDMDAGTGSDALSAAPLESKSPGEEFLNTANDTGGLAGDVQSGDRVTLLWSSTDGSRSTILGEFTAQ